MKRWTWYIAVAALCLGVAGTVEVHFESKDGGFFLKQIPRSYHLASSGAAGAGAAAAAGVGLGGTTSVVGEDQDNDEAVLGAGVGGGAGSVLSVDRFTVFQTAEPVSVRASYGPFSTKQTVPARYIVPDPVDQLPGSGQDAPLNISQLGVARHLDMSAHIVRADVARDQPVLRVLFHTGGEPARAARQHAARQQRVCIVLHASVPNRPPLSAACSPDGEDGVCLAQVTIPHTWWPPLPPLPPPEELTTGVSSGEGGAGPESAGLGLGLGKTPPRKAPPRVVQLAHSVLEPRGSEPGCVPRVQIQPVTPLGTATLVPARSAYRELRADERLTILLPHAPLYPMSRMHLPVFLQPRPNEPRVAVLIVKARVKPGMRILGAESSSDQWNVSVDMNPKHTVATVTALRRPPGIEEAGAAAAAAAAGPGQGQQDEPPQEQQDQAQQDDQDKQTMPGVSEVFSWLVEVGEDSADDDAYDGRIVWSVRYVLEGSPNNPAEEEEAAAPSEGGPATPEPWTSQQPAEGAADGDVADVAEAADLETGVVGDEQPQADGVAAMGGAAGGAVARARSPRSTHQHHQGHHGHHAGHQGGHQGHHGGHQAHQGHAERHQLHGELVEETRRKLVARFEVQKDDIQAVLPISKNWQLVNTAVLTGRQVSQAMKVFIVSQAGRVADVTLQSSCKTEDDSVLKVSSSCTSVYVDGSEIRGSSNGTVLVKYGTYTGMARFTVWMPQFPLEVVVQDYRLSQIKGWRVRDQDSSLSKSKRSAEDEVDAWDRAGPAAPSDRLVVEDVANSLDHDRDRDRQSSCRVRFQQSPVEVYARFKAEDHDSGRESFFVSRRTLLLVTDLVQSYMRVSDPRVATLHKRVVQGRSSGRTEVQVLSPITGRVIGSKEVRVVADKVSVSRLLVRVVSGLQLSITADSDIENGYVAETSVTRKLTAQYQEGLLDIDIEFSDGTRTPLRDVPVEDYHLIVDSLAPDIVAFAPMGSSASLHPRVIAVRQGRGDLLKVTLLSDELCRGVMRRSKTKSITSHVPLAVATAQVEINFAASDVAQRTEFVQNDGGSIGKDRKSVMSTDLRDILIGIPLQDENNHEPTVQARQHHSSGGGIGGGGGGVLGSIGHSMVSSGSRHHGNVHTTPLEIGMYVLLAAFCFAIVVFVVSCVVYASKFSPQSLDQMGQTAPQGLHGVGAPLSRGAAVSGLGAGVAMVKRQLQMQPQSRDSTTNVHDWVWLGRATLERGSGPGAGSGHLASATTTTSARSGPPLNINNNPVMHITTNPNYADPSDVTEEMELAIAECLSKPEERERERERALSAEPAAGPRIDSSTYCKKDRDRDRDRDRERPRRGDKRHHHHRAHKSASASAQEASGDCWKLTPPPPPLPAHGSSPEKVVPPRDEDPDYKPPVPPHRNIPLVKDLKDLKDDEPSAQPRRHHHHHHHNHHHNRNNSNNQCNKSNQKDQKRHATDEEDELPDPTFVEFPDASPGSTQLQGVSAEVKRANIVGNPMFSSTEEEDDEDDEEDQGEVQRVREELLGLDDLNMDYDQIMEYFDNLKESNA